MDLGSKSRYTTTTFQCASKGADSLDKMDNTKLTRAKGRQGSSSQGNTIGKIEADKKNAAISRAIPGKILKPFVYSMGNNYNFPLSDGGKVIFKREWFIKEVADEVLTIDCELFK